MKLVSWAVLAGVLLCGCGAEKTAKNSTPPLGCKRIEKTNPKNY